MEANGIPWHTMSPYGMIGTSLSSCGMIWNPMKSYGIICMNPHRIPMGSDAFIKMRLDSCRTLGSSIPRNSRIINTWGSGQLRGPPFGCRWIPIDPHWTLWSPMEPYGSHWNPMAHHVTLWIPREIVVILWNNMESYEILWSCLYEPP